MEVVVEVPNSESIARNSASQILSNQLNKLSSQYVKGVNLNLDLNSYEDYQSGTAEDRTQLDVSLSKNLFNDRFRVEVGSQVDLEGQQRTQQEATDIIGNIMVEYLLTEDGRYKLRGYRKNEYEGLIDGQVVVTGIAIQFSKEFEKFNELWQKPEEEDEE
ncbi:translocation/assembly module TamB domain-containing protein [Marivirga tractuosa]|uniref:translocation/assembly module TamB domain-containing protein n=1 Tax=Marivirga tractuosa TaxID=1006 RepID=UPI0035D09BBB